MKTYQRRSSIHTSSDDDDEKMIVGEKSTRRFSGRRPPCLLKNPAFGIHQGSETESDCEPLVINSNEKLDLSTNESFCYIPTRYAVAIWAFFGFFCLYAIRVNLSIAIVAMVAPDNSTTNSSHSCSATVVNETQSVQNYEFTWKPSLQGILLGSFFYGYITTQLIGGKSIIPRNLAEKFGAKWIFGGGILIGGILTLLTPLAARTSVGLLIAIRLVIGMVCAPGSPSAAALWGRWIPISERSTVPPAAQTGSNFGIILTTPIIGLMIDKGFLGGWPSAFYVFGTICCVWFVGWFFFGFNSPEDHPRISAREKKFLAERIPTRTEQHKKTPWRKILLCPSVYGIAILHFCNNYIYYTLLTSLPIYFSTILNFNLKESGFLFALPYFVQFIFTIGFGYVADRIRERKIVSVTVLRKIQTSIGMLGTCSFLVGIGYVGCDHVSAVAFCVLAVGFLGLQSCGALISHLDVASNYAGTLVAITNSLGTIPGFIGPYIVGAITENNQTVQAWRLIFNISAIVGAFGCVAYCVLFNGEEKSWNRPQPSDRRSET